MNFYLHFKARRKGHLLYEVFRQVIGDSDSVPSLASWDMDWNLGGLSHLLACEPTQTQTKLGTEEVLAVSSVNV